MPFKKIYPAFALLLWFCLQCVESRASHISGVNIEYECLGGEQYLISVNLFRDCEEENPLPPSLNVFITSSCLSVGYKIFDQVSVQEVSQLCAQEMPNSSCNGGLQPGVELAVYQRIVELEPCINWRIIVSEQNRDEAIVNIADPELHSVHVEAFLDNTDPICNSSPELTVLNLPYVCVGSPLFYNLGFEDSDGDSLSYSLVPALASELPTTPYQLAYVGAYSGAEPLTGMSIDPLTGQITVIPGMLGKFNAVVQVEEYRNGELIGIVTYDFLFLVNACNIPPPAPDLSSFAHVSGGAYPLDGNSVGICAEDDFCFEIGFTSEDPAVGVFLSSNISTLIPGATETVTGTNPAIIQFCGSLPPDFTGGSFIITAIDNACPVYGQAYYAIDFTFRQPLEAFGDTVICLGESAFLSAYHDTLYTWFDLDENELEPGAEISCNPCYNPVVSSDTSTYYIVEGLYSGSSCANRDTVFVDVPLGLSAEVVDETCDGNDGIIDITLHSGSGDYDVVWADLGDGPLLRDDLVEGNYQVLIVDNVYGCNRLDSYDISRLQPPTASAGVDRTICGLTIELDAEPSFGLGTWSAPDGGIFSNANLPDATVEVPAEGSYRFVWTEDADFGCADSDTMQVIFYAQPFAEILSNDTICGNSYTIEALVGNGNITWTGPTGLLFSENSIPDPEITNSAYGDASIAVNVSNGPCIANDAQVVRFVEQPEANAGEDQEVCGPTTQVQALFGVGEALWVLPPALQAPGGIDGVNIEVQADTYGVHDLVFTLLNENFCFDSDTVSVRFTEQPEVVLGSDTAVCTNSIDFDFVLPVGDLSWTLSNGLNTDPVVAVPQWFSGDYGQHEAVLYADNGYGCTDSDTVNFHFIEQPQLEQPVLDTVCGLTYFAAPEISGDAQYWVGQFGVEFQAALDGYTIIPSGQGAYIFEWVVENSATCRDTAFYQIQFYAPPPTYAGEDISICGLEANLGGNLSFGDYQWLETPGIGFADQSLPGSAITAEWYGTYTLVASETNGICTGLDTVMVGFYGRPEIINPQTLCTGTDALYTLSFGMALGDSANYEVTGIDGSIENFVFTSLPLESGTAFEVYLYDGGICGSDTTLGSHSCNPITNAGNMAGDTLRLCGNVDFQMAPAEGFALDGNDTLLYLLHGNPMDPLNAAIAWNSTPQFEFQEGMDYETVYFVSAVVGNHINGAIDATDPLLSISQGSPVIYYAVPQAEIGGVMTLCPYDTAMIALNLSGSFPQEVGYSHGGSDFTILAADADTYIAAPDSGIYTLTGTQSAYCTGNVSGTVEVVHYSLPEAVLSGETPICFGDTSEMSIAVEGTPPFGFDIYKDGLPFIEMSSGNFNVDFGASLPGMYTLKNLGDSYCSSVDSSVFLLEVIPLPIADAGGDIDFCNGDTILLGSPALPGHIYQWSNSEGIISPTGLAQVQYSKTESGPFSSSAVLVLEVLGGGCYNADTITVTRHPMPTAQIVGAGSFCAGDSLSLIGFGADSLHWQPEWAFSSSSGYQTFYRSPQGGTISLTATNAIGCADSVHFDVEVLPVPSADFVLSTDSGCAPFMLEAVALDNNPGHLFNWHIQGIENLPNQPLLNVQLSEQGNYILGLSVMAENGCSTTSPERETVKVFDTYADFSYSREKPSISSPEVYFRNTSPLNISSSWAFDSLGISEIRNPYFMFPEVLGGSYTVCLEVLSPEGCRADTCKTVQVRDDFFLYVPNAFTPNGDGLNDLFGPVLSRIDPVEYRFWISNRRGDIVFETNDISKKWDGTHRGNQYFEGNGIYIWNLVAKPDFNVETREYSGTVFLLR